VSSASDPDLPARPALVQINAWYRTALIVLGLAGLGSGAAAVFITQLEAGPVALLLIGLVLLLIGIGGRMPSRIKVGDNEVAWEAFQEFVERVVERTPKDEASELLADLTELAKDAPQAASAGLSAIAYEQLVSRMVYDAFIELPEKTPGTVGVSPFEGTDRGRDMVIDSENRTVVVQVKYPSRPLSADVVAQAAELRARLDENSDRRVALLIVTPRVGRSALEVIKQLQGVYVAIVRGPQDRDHLVMATRAALGLLGENPGWIFG
jgi:hypothetical protein